MPFIKTVPVEEASGLVGELYARQQKTRHGRLPASKMLLSINPQAMKAVEDLRDAFCAGSPHIDARRREMIATVTSALLQCTH
jgi:alkylhydroperoxidase family enzyme